MADRFIFVRGEIDVATAPALLADLRRAIDFYDDDIVVDCFDVTFMGVAGVNALVAANAELRDEGRTLSCRHLSPMTKRMLDVLCIDLQRYPPDNVEREEPAEP